MGDESRKVALADAIEILREQLKYWVTPKCSPIWKLSIGNAGSICRATGY